MNLSKYHQSRLRIMFSSFTKSIRTDSIPSVQIDAKSPSKHEEVPVELETEAIPSKSDGLEHNQKEDQKKSEPDAFDEASISTDNSLFEIPLKTVFICNEEGKVLHGTGSPSLEMDDDLLDQDKGGTEEIQAEASIHDKEGSVEELLLRVEQSNLDVTELDNIIKTFEEEGEQGRSTSEPKTNEFVIMKPESPSSVGGDLDFNTSTFAALGQALLQGESDTVSHAQSDTSHNRTWSRCFTKLVLVFTAMVGYFLNLIPRLFGNSAEILKASLKFWKREKSAFASFLKDLKAIFSEDHPQISSSSSSGDSVVSSLSCKSKKISGLSLPKYIILALLLPILTIGWVWMFFGMEGKGEQKVVVDAQESCVEESFHLFMYNANMNQVLELETEDIYVTKGVLGNFVAAMVTSVMMACYVRFYQAESIPKVMRKTVCPKKEIVKKEKTGKKGKTLKRELDALDTHNIFSSTVVTDVLSPDGSISSVKRSSRKKKELKTIYETTSMQGTDLFNEFDGVKKE